MFHKHLTLIIFVLISSLSLAQDRVTAYQLMSDNDIEHFFSDYIFKDGDTLKFYFNEYWRMIDNPNTATYYRKAWQENDADLYTVNDYYSNGQIQMSAKAKRPYPFSQYIVYHGEVVRFHKNGDTTGVENYSKGINVGSTWGKYENGNYKYKGQFGERGVEVGKWEHFYENGQLDYTGSYNSEGNETGVWKYYYEGGELAAEMTYDDGELEDEYKAYFENGNVKREGEYKKGDRHGEYTYYFENGNVDRKYEYKRGDLHRDIAGYYESGKIKYKGEYKRGDRRKERIYYHENGKVEETYYYDRKGNLEEKSNAVYADGSTHIERSYNRDGQLHGEYKRYLKNGTLKEKKEFKKGEVVGDDVLYYDNGKKHKIMTYVDGITTEIKYFDREGNQVAKSDFIKEPEFEGYLKGVFNTKMKIPKDFKTTSRAVLHFRVNKQGKVDSASVITSGNFYSDSVAVQTLKNIEFDPGVFNFEKASFSNEMVLNTSREGDTKITLGEFYYTGDKNDVFYGVEKEMDFDIAATATLEIEKSPIYKGGEKELFSYLGDNINYPEVSSDIGSSGVAYIQFIVEPSGVISSTEILRGVDPFIDYESIRVVNKMPAWKPGKQYDKNVRVDFNLPIRYTLN